MSKRSRWIIGAICVVYVAVRIWRLSDSCLWFDEIFSVHAAEHPWGSLFWFVARDLIHPPLFYVVLKLWIGLAGEGIFWLRMLPVFFSALALVPFFHLGKELKLERPVIAIGMFFFAMNGALIKYTQTLRMYSMLMFLALASMWLFARYFNRGKSFVPLLITNLLLVYTHYYGWLVVGTEIVILLFFQLIKWRRAVVMTGVLAISYVPWVWAIWKAAGEGSDVVQNIAWQPRPGGRELLTFLIDLVEPVYFQASSNEPASIYAIAIPILLISIAAVAIYFFSSGRDEKQDGVRLLVLFALLPFIVTFAASWILPQSVWGTRHLIVIFPPVMLLVANAVWKIGNQIARIVLLTGIVFLSVVAVGAAFARSSPQYVWCAWNDVAAEIKAAEQRPSEIYTFENLVAYHMWFALRDTDRFKIGVVKGIDVRNADETYFLPRGFEDVERANIDGIKDDRFWLAFRSSAAGDDAPVRAAFSQRGFKECQFYHVGYGSTTVFWVKMGKSSESCRQTPQVTDVSSRSE